MVIKLELIELELIELALSELIWAISTVFVNFFVSIQLCRVSRQPIAPGAGSGGGPRFFKFGLS